MRPTVAVILFPGTNCELESLRACERAGMKPEIFRWNDNRRKLKNYDAFIIPGGFSYEDRGRSGIIASKDPIMESIKKEADNGKVVFGICNGAQVLVEAGLIPGLTVDQPEMGLNWNERIYKGKILGKGFYNDWIYMRSDSKKGRSAFNNFGQDQIMRIPIAHAEGRFTIKNPEVLKSIIENDQTVFRYCDANGKFVNEFPVNPNGAVYNLAGVCNKEGNVMSLMPHPERTEVEGQPIFDSVAEYLTGGFKIVKPKSTLKAPRIVVEDNIKIQKKKPDIEIQVKLIITDNEERTIENTMKQKGFKNLKLKRRVYFGIHCKKESNKKKIAEKLLKTGEIANLNKEIPIITIDNKDYLFDKKQGLTEKPVKTQKQFSYVVKDLDNYAGKSVFSKIKTHFPQEEVTKIEKGVMWNIGLKKQESVNKLIKTHIFHNPNAANIMALK